MVGYGANKGIVPISCEEIFNRIAANRNPDISDNIFKFKLKKKRLWSPNFYDWDLQWESLRSFDSCQ